MDAESSGGAESRQVPAWRWRVADFLMGGRGSLAIPIILAVLLLLFPIWSGHDQYWMRQLSLIAILALTVSGLNLSFGYAGELQFSQVFMFALGGYATAVVAVRGYAELVPLLLLAGVLASLVGLLVALPAVRIGGWSLAIVSFFLVILIPDLLQITVKYTGGTLGLVGIPPPNVFGHALSPEQLFLASAVCLIVWLALFRNLVKSRFGVMLRVLRESPALAESLGSSPRRLKAWAYAIGAVPAGVAGCLFGFVSLVLTPDSFGLDLAIGIVAASVLSGVESIYGVIVGAAILQLAPEESLTFSQYATIIYGVFLIVAALVLRNGISGLGRRYCVLLARRMLRGSGESTHVGVRGYVSATGATRADARAISKDGGLGRPQVDHDANHGSPERNAGRLSVHDISKTFGGLVALQDVSLGAEPGEVTALIGSNGSGKTTLLNVICGYASPDAGNVEFAGERLTDFAPHQVARLHGVARTFQTPIIPRGVSVLDAVASGCFAADRVGAVTSIFRLPKYWRVRGTDRSKALAVLELVGLAEIADQEAQELALGTRRLVEVARALCSEPQLLLLDEPASGLTEEEVKRLGDVVKATADRGVTVILIEHNFRFVTNIADTVHVLDFGQLIASGTAAEIGSNPRVIQSYLGSSSRPESRVRARATGSATVRDRETEHESDPTPLLMLRDAVTGYADLQVLRGVSLKLYQGEVEVLLGRNGVGKTTTLAAISGQLSLWRGELLFDGRDVTNQSSFQRARDGISLVQQGKRIFRQRTVLENLFLGTHALDVSRGDRAEVCEGLLDRFPILKQRASQEAGALSGGQQQMLAIAQALAARPRVLLLDEPSAGLAPAILDEVLDQIQQLRDQGLTILLVEQLAEHALTLADHVTILDNGAIVNSGPPESFHDLRDLQEAYLGTPAPAHTGS